MNEPNTASTPESPPEPESGPEPESETKPASETPKEASPAGGATLGDLQRTVLEEKIVDALRTIFDPEIPVNIYELGLIYGIDIDPQCDVKVDMTLTSPMCPVAESLPPEVEMRVSKVEGVGKVAVTVVWEPTWTPDKMSEAAKLQLGMQ